MRRIGIRHQQGYTLVELIVVQLLGLILLAGILNLVPSGLSLSRSADAVSLLQENQRLALDTLDHRIAEAGFAGCHNGPSHTRVIATGHPDVSPRLANWAYDRFRLFGSDAGDVDTTELIMGANWSRSRYRFARQDIGDLLWTQSVSGSALQVVDHDPEGEFLLVRAVEDTTLGPGTVLRISDCDHAATFQLSPSQAIPWDRDSGLMTLRYGALDSVNCRSGGSDSSDSRVRLGGRISGDCSTQAGTGAVSRYQFPPGSTVAPLSSQLLYIGSHQETGEPGLYRLTMAANGSRPHTEAIVEGVENMRIQYGVDGDGDDAPDTWINATGVGRSDNAWEAVIAVRVWLMLRTTDHRGQSRFRSPVSFPDETGALILCDGQTESPAACPFDTTSTTEAGYRRRVVERTIMLRNRS